MVRGKGGGLPPACLPPQPEPVADASINLNPDTNANLTPPRAAGHSYRAPPRHAAGNATTWSIASRMPIFSPSAWLWCEGTRDSTREPDGSSNV